MARYGKKTKYKGIIFDSETECDFYKMLELKLKKKEIKSFKHEPEYILLEGDWENARGDKQEPIKYYPDFIIETNDGDVFLVDTKGIDLHEDTSLLKKKMFEYQNRDLILYFVSKSPLYLSDQWVETSPYRNMLQKLRSAYKKEHPTVKTKGKNAPRFTVKDWEKYMEVESIHGLFYTFNKVYTKKEREKMEKEKSK